MKLPVLRITASSLLTVLTAMSIRCRQSATAMNAYHTRWRIDVQRHQFSAFVSVINIKIIIFYYLKKKSQKLSKIGF